MHSTKSAAFTSIQLMKNEKILFESGPEKRAVWSAIFTGMLPLLFLIAFFGTMIFLATKPWPKSVQRIASEQSRGQDSVYYDSVLTYLIEHEDELEPEYDAAFFNLSPNQHIVATLMVILFLIALKVVISIKMHNNRWYLITNERVMVQSGILDKRVVILDLDKINSIQQIQNPIDSKLNLITIDLILTGITIQQGNNTTPLISRNALVGLESDSPIVNQLTNLWLIRDNQVTER